MGKVKVKGLSETWKFPPKPVESKKLNTTPSSPNEKTPLEAIKLAACGVFYSSRLLYAIFVSGAFHRHIKFLVRSGLLRIPEDTNQWVFKRFSDKKEIPWQQDRRTQTGEFVSLQVDLDSDGDQDTFAILDTGDGEITMAIQGWVKLFVQHLHAKKILEIFANRGQVETPIDVKVYGISSSKNSALPTSEVLEKIIKSSLPNETTEKRDKMFSVFKSYFETRPQKKHNIFDVVYNIIGETKTNRSKFYNVHCEAALASLVAASKARPSATMAPFANEEMVSDLYVGLVPSIQDNDSHIPTEN